MSSRILIADDDPNLRMMLRAAMEQEGYAVFEADDGQQALDCYATVAPDLVLLDALMPNMDGFEVCKALKMQASRIPVLMITALEESEAVDYAFEVGAVDYITKPIHWAVLKQRVRRLLMTRELEQMRDNLTQMIVHDMKNPIGTIQGYAEYILQTMQLTEELHD